MDSVCPVCLQPIATHVFEESGRVQMEKRCGERGACRDADWCDVAATGCLRKPECTSWSGRATNGGPRGISGLPRKCGGNNTDASRSGQQIRSQTRGAVLHWPLCFSHVFRRETLWRQVARAWRREALVGRGCARMRPIAWQRSPAGQPAKEPFAAESAFWSHNSRQFSTTAPIFHDSPGPPTRGESPLAESKE